jgi:hypothetical protein
MVQFGRMQRILSVYAVLLLTTSVYFGFGNTSDILNTATIAQKLVGITATAYALAALGCFEGMRRSASWLYPLVMVWATLVVGTVILAAIVYAQDTSVAANLAIVGACALLVAPVVTWARARSSRSTT